LACDVKTISGFSSISLSEYIISNQSCGDKIGNEPTTTKETRKEATSIVHRYVITVCWSFRVWHPRLFVRSLEESKLHDRTAIQLDFAIDLQSTLRHKIRSFWGAASRCQ
jgi:hypothetical protein